MKPKHLLGKNASSAALIFTFLVGPACANGGKSSDDAASKQPQAGLGADAQPISPASKPTGDRQIIIGFKANAKYKDVTGYVVGAVDAHGFKSLGGNEGRYAMSSMKPGTYDIILEAQKISDISGEPATPVGLRLSGLVVLPDSDNIVQNIDLLPYSQLKGQVLLLNGVSHGAIKVEIPGTRIKTLSGADGAYALDKVPVGWHDITMSNAGFFKGTIERQKWTSESHSLSSLTLLPDNDVQGSGVYYRGLGLSSTETNKITLFLNRPLGMNKFRWSETSDFAAATWIPFQSSIELTLPASGERKIFIQYSKDQQQLSTIYSADIRAL